ncbi:Hypothetical predicted protein [Olea europaea subsp. europaea]|uniref:NADH dehydrogenase [ubiquinone] 1 alpha subcomplex assembly factor 3 n=1 Tax=Olea europaea subsp. europaea TaxID=158383 RepID=A0A8S0PGR6_OLEEU|nr:Hypothetical predicted protein [Olea europaea subsp. europaea]
MAVRQRAVAALPTLLRALRKEGISKQNQPLPSLRRAFSLYDQINLIDNVPEDQLRFQEFDDTGFKVNGVRYEGSLLCVGNLLMSWTPKKFSEITTERYFSCKRYISISFNYCFIFAWKEQTQYEIHFFYFLNC